MTWRDHAACVGQQGDLFFPVGTGGPAAQQVENAKKICAGCSVRDACLLWAVETGANDGIWGGLTEAERRAWIVRRRRRRAVRANQLTLSRP